MCSDRRRRYDDDFKRVAYSLIGRGYGRGTLARGLDVSQEMAKQLIMEYHLNGGKIASMGNRTYDYETKLAAVREHVVDGASKIEVMSRYGISSQGVLKKWCALWREGGDEALRPKRRGRRKGSSPVPRVALDREQELEAEVRYLRAQVAYLGKVRALRASRSATETGPRSSKRS